MTRRGEWLLGLAIVPALILSFHAFWWLLELIAP